MPRHNCSHMQRFFRNVHVVSVRNQDSDELVPEMWFYKEPAKHVRQRSRNKTAPSNWDIRFNNNGQKTPVQRWIYAQATGAILHTPSVPGLFEPYLWFGDEYKVYQKRIRQQDISLPAFTKYFHDHPDEIQFMQQERPRFWFYNPMFKIVSPWNLGQTNHMGVAHKITTTTPLPIAIHRPDIKDVERRVAMLVAYSRGKDDREVDRMIYEGEI